MSRDEEPLDGYCKICETNPREVGARCATCHRYLKRNGVERPPELARRQASLNRRRLEHGSSSRGPRLPRLWGGVGARMGP